MFNSPKFNVSGIRVVCQFHSQGLDQDISDHYATLTATFDLPKNPKKASVLNQQSPVFKLSVFVYEGAVEKKHLIGESSAARKLDDEDRQQFKMHMTVHRVVSLEELIFSEICPNKIIVKIVVEV